MKFSLYISYPNKNGLFGIKRVLMGIFFFFFLSVPSTQLLFRKEGVVNEEGLLPFIYRPKGKAKFESDCVDYEGDKTAANLLSVSFKNLSDGAVVLS